MALHPGPDRYAAEIADGRFRIARGESPDPDAVLTPTAGTLQAVIFAGAEPPTDAVTGDRALSERFVRIFPRPVPRTSAGG